MLLEPLKERLARLLGVQSVVDLLKKQKHVNLASNDVLLGLALRQMGRQLLGGEITHQHHVVVLALDQSVLASFEFLAEILELCQY